MGKLNNINFNNLFYSRKFSYSKSNLPPYCTPSINNIIAKADSGASNHYFQENDLEYITNPVKDKKSPGQYNYSSMGNTTQIIPTTSSNT